jgi:hypothetical protein
MWQERPRYPGLTDGLIATGTPHAGAFFPRVALLGLEDFPGQRLGHMRQEHTPDRRVEQRQRRADPNDDRQCVCAGVPAHQRRAGVRPDADVDRVARLVAQIDCVSRHGTDGVCPP